MHLIQEQAAFLLEIGRVAFDVRERANAAAWESRCATAYLAEYPAEYPEEVSRRLRDDRKPEPHPVREERPWTP